MRKTRVRSLGWEDPLEKGMAIHSSTIAWKIPWTEEPGRVQSTRSQSRTRLSDFTYLLRNLWEKTMAPHASTLAWKIPWMKEPGRLQFMGSLRVRHD